MGTIVAVTVTLVGAVVLVAVLMGIGKAKPIHGWPLVAVGWVGSGFAILVNKLFLRPEMDLEGAILAVTPVLFIITALPLLSKKYGKASEPQE